MTPHRRRSARPLLSLLALAALAATIGWGAAAPQAPQPVAVPRVPARNLQLAKASRLLADLDDESSLFLKLDAQPVLRRGTLAQGFAALTVPLGDGRQEALGSVAGSFLAEQGAFAQQARGAARGALSAPVEVQDEVLEFDDAYAVLHTTRVVVTDPRALAAASPVFATYLGRSAPPQGLSRASLPPGSLPGFEAFLRTELPTLPPDDPLRRAFSTGGEPALLQAIAEGRGTFEITDTLYVPKALPPAAP